MLAHNMVWKKGLLIKSQLLVSYNQTLKLNIVLVSISGFYILFDLPSFYIFSYCHFVEEMKKITLLDTRKQLKTINIVSHTFLFDVDMQRVRFKKKLENCIKTKIDYRLTVNYC